MSDNAIDIHDDRFMTSLYTDCYYTVSMQTSNWTQDAILNCYDTNSKTINERMNADCVRRRFI